MTLAALDPSSTSTGFCVYVDGACVRDGRFSPSHESPAACLSSIVGLVEELHAEFPLDGVATEKAWSKSYAFQPYSITASLIPTEVECWAAKKGIPFTAISASTVKAAFGITKSVTGGKRIVAKRKMYAQVQHLMTEESKAIPRENERHDVADAHAVMWVYRTKYLPKKK